MGSSVNGSTDIGDYIYILISLSLLRKLIPSQATTTNHQEIMKGAWANC